MLIITNKKTGLTKAVSTHGWSVQDHNKCYEKYTKAGYSIKIVSSWDGLGNLEGLPFEEQIRIIEQYKMEML